MFRLAKLEWERRDAKEAKKYLQEAFDIADRTNMYDRSIMYLDLMTEIAVAEKNFEDAYRFTQERMSCQAKLDSISEGFDSEKYHLQLQRDQLETEKQRQALELEFSKSRLKATIAIVVLVVLLAVGLLYGLYKQRKAKQQIAVQYTLIQQQAEQLKQLDAAKSRFFANISHELRTPLSLVTGPIHTLLKGNTSSEKQEKLLAMANRGAKDLRHLVDEILDLVKMEAGKMTISPEATPVASFSSAIAPSSNRSPSGTGLTIVSSSM